MRQSACAPGGKGLAATSGRGRSEGGRGNARTFCNATCLVCMSAILPKLQLPLWLSRSSSPLVQNPVTWMFPEVRDSVLLIHDPAAAPKRVMWAWLGTLAFLLTLWGLLINQLRLDWETNPQYSYGWLVPLLAAYLFWVRWRSRPEPELTAAGWVPAAAAAVLALALLPTRLVREATPEWSVVSWALAFEVVGLTLLALVVMGGWRSMRHFAFPVCFFLVAVAWPVRFETALTQTLMQQLAALTAELLGWAGVSALPQGNLLRLSTGVVGVDEACSGVRSLQSMLMASLFLGELNRLSWWSRLALVGAGLALAVVCNVVRALALVTVAIREGLPALEKWHDPAGFSILLVSFGGLCVLVRLFPRAAGVHADRGDELVRSWRPLPTRWLVPLAVWLLGTELTMEVWYRWHETPATPAAAWALRWPENRPNFTDRPISPTVRKLLAYNEGRQASWQGDDGSNWLVFFFKWYPARTSTISARQHRPEVCLPAGGAVLMEERPSVMVPCGDFEVTFRSFRFDSAGEPLHVFFCLWEAGNRDLEGWTQNYSRASRLRRVVRGQRNLGQQSLEFILSGVESSEAAEEAFRRGVEQMLVPAKF